MTVLIFLPFFTGTVLSAIWAPTLETSEESRAAAAATDYRRCVGPDRLALLAAQEPGLVSASSNQGAHILPHTRHRMIAAPYHRIEDDMIEQLRIAIGTAGEAEERLRRLGVRYVMVCTAETDYDMPDVIPDDAFFPQLERGGVPAFLEHVAGSPQRFDGGMTEIMVFSLR